MRLQQLFEAYDTSGDGDCLCENLQVFHPNLLDIDILLKAIKVCLLLQNSYTTSVFGTSKKVGIDLWFSCRHEKHLGTLSKEEMTVVFEQLGALSLLMKFLLCAVGTRVKTKRMLCCCNSKHTTEHVRGIKGSNYMFKKIDGNKDGKVQVHEFISWLFQKDPKCSLSDDVTDGNGAWTMYAVAVSYCF